MTAEGAARPPVGAASAPDDLLIAPAALPVSVVRRFAALGSDPREAGLVADHLVRADLYAGGRCRPQRRCRLVIPRAIP